MAFFFKMQSLLPDLSASSFSPPTLSSGERWRPQRARPQYQPKTRHLGAEPQGFESNVLKSEFADVETPAFNTAVFEAKGASRAPQTGNYPDRTQTTHSRARQHRKLAQRPNMPTSTLPTGLE